MEYDLSRDTDNEFRLNKDIPLNKDANQIIPGMLNIIIIIIIINCNEKWIIGIVQIC